MHFVRERANLKVLTCSTDERYCRRVVRGSVGLEMVEDRAGGWVYVNVDMVRVPGSFLPLHPYEALGRKMLADELERLQAGWVERNHELVAANNAKRGWRPPCR